MDIKTEIEIKDEPLKSTQDFRNNGQNFEQDFGVEKIQQKKRIKLKVEVKEDIEINDPFYFTEEYSENDNIDLVSGLDESQHEKKNNPKVEAKEEIEINDPFYFTEEYSENGEHVEKISKLDESREKKINLKVEVKDDIEINEPFNFMEEYSVNDQIKQICNQDESQITISGMGKRIKGGKLIAKSSLRCEPETSQRHHQVMKEMDLRKVHCTSCNLSFKSKEELKSHMKSHTETKFKCALCSYESNYKSKLKSHELTHLDVKLLKCSECSYECNSKGYLKSHMIKHTETKSIKCSECSYECKRKGSLRLHMLKHLKHKLFKCNDCNFECNNKGELTKHVLAHVKDEDNKKWTLSRNLYLMECYYISELIPTIKDQNELWKKVVENNKFNANDYMYFRFIKKFEKLHRNTILKQKHYILNMAKKMSKFNKSKFTLPTKEVLEEIKLKAKNIVENEMEMTVELELLKKMKIANNHRRYHRNKQVSTHVEEEKSYDEGSENEGNRKREKDVKHEIDTEFWKNVRVKNIFQ